MEALSVRGQQVEDTGATLPVDIVDTIDIVEIILISRYLRITRVHEGSLQRDPHQGPEAVPAEHEAAYEAAHLGREPALGRADAGHEG